MNLRLVVVIGGNNIMVHLIDKAAVVADVESIFNGKHEKEQSKLN